MRISRWLVTCFLVLGVLVLSVPALTLASGGGSAGDQQYTDPFAGTAPGKTKSTTQSTPTTQPQTATSAPPTSAPSTVTPVASTSTSGDPTTPTATIASTTGTAGKLPYTGYDGWLAAGLGFVLVGGGLGLRARLRRT